MTSTTRPRVRTSRSRVRLTPQERREQLLALGLELFGKGTIEDVSIDRLAGRAGISRGLMYHYFGSKQGFREAVVRRAAADLVAQTAPVDDPDPLVRLRLSMRAYVDYVVANLPGYRSLVSAAAGGSPEFRAIYDEARGELTDRIFREETTGELLPDTPAVRLLVSGWSSFAEQVVLAWCDDPAGIERDELVEMITAALPAVVTAALE